MNRDLKSADTTQHAVNTGKLVSNLATSLMQSRNYSKSCKSVDTVQHTKNAGKLVNNLAASLVQSGKHTK